MDPSTGLLTPVCVFIRLLHSKRGKVYSGLMVLGVQPIVSGGLACDWLDPLLWD